VLEEPAVGEWRGCVSSGPAADCSGGEEEEEGLRCSHQECCLGAPLFGYFCILLLYNINAKNIILLLIYYIIAA